MVVFGLRLEVSGSEVWGTGLIEQGNKFSGAEGRNWYKRDSHDLEGRGKIKKREREGVTPAKWKD